MIHGYPALKYICEDYTLFGNGWLEALMKVYAGYHRASRTEKRLMYLIAFLTQVTQYL